MYLNRAFREHGVSAVQDYSKNVFLNALPDWALSLHVNCDDPEHWTYDDVHCVLAMFWTLPGATTARLFQVGPK